MEKYLKNYLPFYLGSDVLVKDSVITGTGNNGIVENNLFGRLTSTSILGNVKQKYRVVIGGMSVERPFNLETDKLILRPLPSMTEEEKIRLYLWEFPDYKSGELIKNDSDTDFFVVKNENGMKCYVNQHHFSAETTRKLLAASFDLFNLIESGLALDKTKIDFK